MDTEKILEALTAPSGLSGSENLVREAFRELTAPYCSEMKTDRLGNMFAYYRCGKKDAPLLMLEAHMDEIGLMVSGYTKEDSLLFVPIGGFDPKVLPGSEVTLHAKDGDFFGVIGAKPPHLLTDRTSSVPMKDMCIDIGFEEEETRKRVKIGDLITFNTEYTKLGDSRLAARCFDNRAGLASLVKALEYMEKYKLDCDVVLCAAVQEEVGLRGARVACEKAVPDAAIVVDAGFGTSANSSEGFDLGSGVIVSVGPNLHPKLNELIFKAAKDASVEVTVDVEGGNTGTDAWEIQVYAKGVPTALLSYPTRYMHSTYEVIDKKDIDSIAKLLAETAACFKGGETLCY